MYHFGAHREGAQSDSFAINRQTANLPLAEDQEFLSDLRHLAELSGVLQRRQPSNPPDPPNHPTLPTPTQPVPYSPRTATFALTPPTSEGSSEPTPTVSPWSTPESGDTPSPSDTLRFDFHTFTWVTDDDQQFDEDLSGNSIERNDGTGFLGL